MSNQSTKTSSHHAFLWTQFDGPGFRKLRAALRDAPNLPGLEVISYCDGETAMFRISYQADAATATALRAWASLEGVDLVDTSHWSAAHRQDVATGIIRFRCGDERRLIDGAILDLAELLEESTGVDADPASALEARKRTLMGTSAAKADSSVTTLRAAVDRHLDHVSNKDTLKIVRRRTRAWWGQRTDNSARAETAH